MIGGNIIDEINKTMFDVLRHLYNIDDKLIIPFWFNKKNKYLPNPEYQQIMIEFDMSKEWETHNINKFAMEIDIYLKANVPEIIQEYIMITTNTAHMNVCSNEIKCEGNTVDLFTKFSAQHNVMNIRSNEIKCEGNNESKHCPFSE